MGVRGDKGFPITNWSLNWSGIEKWWIMDNQTAGAYTLTVKVSGQTGITWGASDKGTKILYGNGTDVVDTNVGGGVGGYDLNGEELILAQIAGLIARRILNYMKPGMVVAKGQSLGFIRFGSRVDIIVPTNFKINVSLGDIVKGNLSIIGEFDKMGKKNNHSYR